jgi:hypothetical protein
MDTVYSNISSSKLNEWNLILKMYKLSTNMYKTVIMRISSNLPTSGETLQPNQLDPLKKKKN